MHILFFSQISPFPINRGERIRSYGLIKSLSETGHIIDAIINNEEKIDLKEYILKNVTYHEYPFHNNNFFNNLTGAHYFIRQKKVLMLFNELISKKKPDVVFLDYAFIGQYISFFKEKGISVIYGTHNSQSSLTLQAPSKNVGRNCFKYYKVGLQRIHERLYFKKTDILLTVSQEDKIFHSKFVKKEKIHVIPNFLDENRYSASFIKEDYFIMTANFTAYQNIEGLKWFLEHVWNHQLDSISTKLLLVGNNSKKLYNSLDKANNFKNIHAIGEVEDMIPYIGKARAVIVPLLHGSGSRLKCLEAMALKTKIIATSKGVEGITSKFFEIADDPEEFRKLLLKYSKKIEVSHGAYNDFLKNYSLKINKIKIDKIIDAL